MKNIVISTFVLMFALGMLAGDLGVRHGYLGRHINEDKAIRDAHDVIVCWNELDTLKEKSK